MTTRHITDYLREKGYLIFPHTNKSFNFRYTSVKELLSDFNRWVKHVAPSEKKYTLVEFKKALLSGSNIVLRFTDTKTPVINLEIIDHVLHGEDEYHQRVYATEVAYSEIEHSTGVVHIEEEIRRALSINSNIQPLDKHERSLVLAMIQKKFALVAMGELTTERITYKRDRDIYRETSKVISTHLPSLDYAVAFSTISRLLDELEDDAEFGASDDEVMSQYIVYVKEQKENMTRMKNRA